jgi:isoleucyl-tRNA synthetase
VGAYAKELGYASAADAVAAITREVPGAELEGIHYDRLWDYYADAPGMEQAWRVLVADYVATGEGTGIVHQAPAYGEDDQVTTAGAGSRCSRPTRSSSRSCGRRAGCSR